MSWPYSMTFQKSGSYQISDELGYYTPDDGYKMVSAATAYVGSAITSLVTNITTSIYGEHNIGVTVDFDIEQNHSIYNYYDKLYLDVTFIDNYGIVTNETYECDFYITPYWFYQESSAITTDSDWTPWGLTVNSSFEPNLYAYSLSKSSGASWITLRSYSDFSKSKVTGDWITNLLVIFDDNETASARTATITATYDDGSNSGTFTWNVTQLASGSQPAEGGSIVLVEPSINVSANQHTGLTFDFNVTNIVTSSLTITTPETWIHTITTPTQVSGSTYRATYEVSYQMSYEPRSGSIYVRGIDTTGDYVQVYFSVSQDAAIRTSDFYPIWKEIKYEEHPVYENYIDYSLVCSDGASYKLRSYTNNSSNSIVVNDIAADHVYDSLVLRQNDAGHGVFVRSDTAVKNFKLYKYTQDGLSLCTDYTIANDWSYIDYPIQENVVYLSDPISHVLDSRQLFLFTFYNRFADNPVIVKLNSITETSITSNGHYTFVQNFDVAEWPGDFEPQSFNNDFLHYYYGSVHEGGNMILNFNDVFRFNIINSCKRYCLYYMNARGGWDTLLVDGKIMRTDNYTNNTYEQNFSSADKSNWGVVNFSKDVKATWQLCTGYLLDSQAEKMYNILGSTKAYLHDLTTGELWSVVVNNKKCEYKTYTNQGRKAFIYTIEVEASQKMKRGN